MNMVIDTNHRTIIIIIIIRRRRRRTITKNMYQLDIKFKGIRTLNGFFKSINFFLNYKPCLFTQISFVESMMIWSANLPDSNSSFDPSAALNKLYWSPVRILSSSVKARQASLVCEFSIFLLISAKSEYFNSYSTPIRILFNEIMLV